MARNRMPVITLTGDKELYDLLTNLPGNLMREAEIGMREVGKKVAESAKANITKGHGYRSGLLKRSLGVKWIKKLPGEKKIVMYVGPRTKYESTVGKRKHVPWRIAHFVEFGHKIKPPNKKKLAIMPSWMRVGREYVSSYKKETRAMPFLRPAVDANKTTFTRTMIDRIKFVLERRAARRAAKA